MFGLIRWLFLLTVIAGLTAFIVAFRFRGKTPAEGFCRLAQNQECLRLAERGEALVTQIHGWIDDTPQPHKARRETRETPRVPRAAIEAPPGETQGPPLDRHTPGERKALNDLLLQHGSR